MGPRVSVRAAETLDAYRIWRTFCKGKSSATLLGCAWVLTLGMHSFPVSLSHYVCLLFKHRRRLLSFSLSLAALAMDAYFTFLTRFLVLHLLIISPIINTFFAGTMATDTVSCAPAAAAATTATIAATDQRCQLRHDEQGRTGSYRTAQCADPEAVQPTDRPVQSARAGWHEGADHNAPAGTRAKPRGYRTAAAAATSPTTAPSSSPSSSTTRSRSFLWAHASWAT